MTSMDQIHRIRDLYYVQDKSLSEIASIEKVLTMDRLRCTSLRTL